MRKLMDIFVELMLELDLISSAEAPWSYESGRSNFITVKDKCECYFSKKSIGFISEISETLYEN
jgi:predicted metalloprotease